ncbi:hypothetical protein OUZ56_026789 [Daphnia magna]|uniref:Uncharacterized protein n=1 Tax=Daphnia magna TaxID=35525 RepID=A0ABQ9ZMU1_9CRUS|nr:hypothetical protein OUZ56_026789 [Daphnia magna]
MLWNHSRHSEVRALENIPFPINQYKLTIRRKFVQAIFEGFAAHCLGAVSHSVPRFSHCSFRVSLSRFRDAPCPTACGHWTPQQWPPRVSESH